MSPDKLPPAVKTPRAERLMRILTAAAGVALTVLAGWVALMRAGGSLVSLSYDVPFLMPRAVPAEDVSIVYLEKFEAGALVRTDQAALLDKLGEAGVKIVLYDIVFEQPSKDPKVDEAFAAAIRRFRGVDEAGKAIPGMPHRTVLLACRRDRFAQKGAAAGAVGEQLIPPTDTLLAAADDFGLVLFMPDDSYTVRELTTGTRDEPSITWKAATAFGAKLDEATRLDPRWINYEGKPETTFAFCTAETVLNGVAPHFLRDHIVIVGGAPGIAGTALGEDLFNTPYNRFDPRAVRMSGPELQANALANLLRGNWLTRSTHHFDVLMVIVAGLLAGAGLARVRPVRAFVGALACIIILAVAGTLAAHYGNVWFPWTVAAFLQIPIALVWGTASHFYIERFFRLKVTAEQRHLRVAFAKYLSPQMLDRLTAEGFRMTVGGEKVMAAMMFTDIESFTEMCQRVRDPQRIVETLNDYFHRTTGHIFQHDGVIIKFIGDAIFAAWGAPLADPQAPLKAARAAWKLSQSDQLTVDGVDLKTRIGVHFGEVVAGNIGTDQHVDYTLIGDAVNLASRLEGLNKVLDTHILISDTVAASLGSEFRTRRVGKFRVKGRSEISGVHELLGPALQEEEPDWVAAYHKALAALESGDHATARTHFVSANSARSRYGDGPSRFFLECLDNREPLPGGIVDMKEK